MLEKLGQTIKKATDKIANAIFLDKNLVDSIIRDLQRALIEADVNISLVKDLSDKIRKSALDERIKGIEKKEHITIFYGQKLSNADLESTIEAIKTSFPQQEVEVHEGGQPFYQFIVSIE